MEQSTEQQQRQETRMNCYTLGIYTLGILTGLSIGYSIGLRTKLEFNNPNQIEQHQSQQVTIKSVHSIAPSELIYPASTQEEIDKHLKPYYESGLADKLNEIDSNKNSRLK